jgi:HD-like signal output (HDOD) protein
LSGQPLYETGRLFDVEPIVTDDAPDERVDPVVVARRLCMDRSSDLRSLVTVIQDIPGLAAKLLQRANSPFFRPRQPVRDLGRAVGLLGRQEVLHVLESHQS